MAHPINPFPQKPRLKKSQKNSMMIMNRTMNNCIVDPSLMTLDQGQVGDRLVQDGSSGSKKEWMTGQKMAMAIQKMVLLK